jgi:hypothetical protein
MFVGEAKNLPYSGAPERCFARIGSEACTMKLFTAVIYGFSQ